MMESQPFDDPINKDEQHSQLLEERLNVEIYRQKIGQVVIRKEVETRIVKIPLRREKLIVEQVSPEIKKLAEIKLGEDKEIETDRAIKTTFEAHFSSLEQAITVLSTLYHQFPQVNVDVQVQLMDDNPKAQQIILENLENWKK